MFNLNFDVLQSKIGRKFKTLWLLEVRICKKLKPDTLLPLQNNSVSQINKKEIISLTALKVSFSDLGCFNLEFDILQSKIGCE